VDRDWFAELNWFADDWTLTKAGVTTNKDLPPKQSNELLAVVQARFDANQAHHPSLAWAKVQAGLVVRPDKL
jgi:hypothetical protein